MSFENISKSVAAQLNPMDFAANAFDGAVQSPWNALAQLSGGRLGELHAVDKRETVAGTLGSLAGMAVDYAGLSRVTGAALSPLFGGARNTLLASSLQSGLAGGIYGGILTPSEGGADLLTSRLQTAGVDALTFGVMGGANRALTLTERFGANTLGTKMLTGTISGGTAGLTHSFAEAGIVQQDLPLVERAIADTASFAAFGAMFGAVDHGIARAGDAWLKRSLSGSEAKMEAAEMTPEAVAARAGDRIARWYPTLEPRLGIHLTDPNVVLTIGGARGQTEVPIYRPQPGDMQAIKDLSARTEPEGVRFRPKQSTGGANNEPLISVSIENLAGLEHVSKQTKIEGIPPFNAADGWSAVSQWTQSVIAVFEAAQKAGHYPADYRTGHLLSGLIKGYPDAALAGAPRTNYRGAATGIPFADYYACAQPNYRYDAKDAAEVLPHINYWGEILGSYFRSAQHRAMQADPTFLEHRMADTGPAPRKN